MYQMQFERPFVHQKPLWCTKRRQDTDKHRQERRNN